MSTIGTFTATDTGFTGTLRTLTLNAKLKIVRVEKDSEKAPDVRVFAGTTELGAGWSKTSQTERPYISVKLDDPSFPAPIYANLVEVEGGSYNLIWPPLTRDGRRRSPRWPPSTSSAMRATPMLRARL